MIEKTEFTPTPWKAHCDMDGRHRHIAILTEAPEFTGDKWPYHPKIAMVIHGGRSDCPKKIAEANARLMAAAPDLLEALEVMYSMSFNASRGNMQVALKQAEAAIAKARGVE